MKNKKQLRGGASRTITRRKAKARTVTTPSRNRGGVRLTVSGKLDMRYNENKIFSLLEELETFDILDEVFEQTTLTELQNEEGADIGGAPHVPLPPPYEEPEEDDDEPDDVYYIEPDEEREESFDMIMWRRSFISETAFFLTDGLMSSVFVEYKGQRVEVDLDTLERMYEDIGDDYDAAIDKAGISKRYKSYMQFPTTIDPGTNAVIIHWDDVITFEGIDIDSSNSFFDHV